MTLQWACLRVPYIARRLTPGNHLWITRPLLGSIQFLISGSQGLPFRQHIVAKELLGLARLLCRDWFVEQERPDKPR